MGYFNFNDKFQFIISKHQQQFSNNINIVIKTQSMNQGVKEPQFSTISYRNGLYQGSFSQATENRDGFGLIYTTDNHTVIGSNWRDDTANGPTFVFYDHAHYVYGFWVQSVPHGFNAVRMDKIVIMAYYHMGQIQGRMLIIYQNYNLALVLQRNKQENQFEQISKGDIFSDQDFNNYISTCKWPKFQEEWKTLIKFMSSQLTQDEQPKSQRPKLRLVNQVYYRYGYNQGIAIVFDDQYKIISAGLHKKSSLKSLGVKFSKQNFVQEGDFNHQSTVYAFNIGHRPENKIGKIYTNFLLKSFQFINKYLNNPAKLLINYLEQLLKTNLLRKLLAGQITTRKLQSNFASPNSNYLNSNRNRQPDQAEFLRKSRQLEQKQKLLQEKMRLQAYKRQIAQTINKRSRAIQNEQENQDQKIIHKLPVEIATRSGYKKNHSQQRKRSPIFTPDRNEDRSNSPVSISPFKQKIKQKIFNEQDKKKYVYQQTENQLYPKHSASNIKNYNSPHERLQFSLSQGADNSQMVPLIVQNKKKQPIKTKQFTKQQMKQRQRQLQLEIEREKQRYRLRKIQLKRQIQQKQKIKQKQKQQAAKTPQKQKGKLQKYNQVYLQMAQKQKQQNERQKTRKISQKSGGTISFRDPYLEKQTQRQFTNTNVPNIVISNPNKRSPGHKKIIGIEPKPNSPYMSNFNEEQGLGSRKNNVYLKGNSRSNSPSPNNMMNKTVKGSTYLQNYHRTKTSVTPERQKQRQTSKQKQDYKQSRKYNKMIKGFNQNNNIYEKIQSPKSPTTNKNAVANRFERSGKEKPKQQKSIKFNESPIVYDRYDSKYSNAYESSQKRSNWNDSTPNKKKYQYVFQ